MKKKYLYVFLMFFTTSFFFSQELILKVKNPVNIISWVYQKGRLENAYYLCDNNYIILASSQNKQKPIIHVYKDNMSTIISSSFYISNGQFVALDDENTALEAKFDNLEKLTKRKIHDVLVARSIAISPNNEMEVSGFANGFVQTHYLLKHTEKNFDVHFKAHEDEIYSIDFSSMGQYFITSGKDEKIRIWNAKTLSIVKEFSSYPPVPAVFSQFSDNFVYCTSEKTICVSDINGTLQKEIAITDGIRLAKFTEKKDRIAVLTLAKKLEFYNMETGHYEGEIPSLESICAFDINIVTGTILVGTEEGEVYLSSNKDIKKVVLKRNLEKKEQINKAMIVKESKKQKIEEPKTQALSNNILDYFILEDEEEIKENNLIKPFFPIKDETPLEEPMSFAPKVKKASNKKTPVSAKTLDEVVLDEIEFEENPTYNEKKLIDEPNGAIEEPKEVNQDTEVQEEKTEQDNEEKQEEENV